MKQLFAVATLFLAMPAVSQSGDPAKYARCAGSSEMQKCRALVDAVTAETAEAKRARVEKLERERAAAVQQVLKNPATNSESSQQAIESEPKVGMSEYDASNTLWGKPSERNRTVTERGSREQWVFGGGRFVYLENGRVTAVTTRQ
ncbi:MAG: hypothetical protein Q8N13_14425 [Acidovorax sp.]|nr:hypothetical protein [Acidovorax sp.]